MIHSTKLTQLSYECLYLKRIGIWNVLYCIVQNLAGNEINNDQAAGVNKNEKKSFQNVKPNLHTFQ